MFKEAINNYLHTHGYESIDLKAVLFDMDGVLFDSMPNHAESWYKIMKRFGFGLSREEAYMHEGRTGASTINIVSRRERGYDATEEEIKAIYQAKTEEFNKCPKAERMALKKGGFKPNEALVIENAPLGVQAGVAAGIFTIAVNTGPLPDSVLLDEGANLLFHSMPDFNENWETLKQDIKNK